MRRLLAWQENYLIEMGLLVGEPGDVQMPLVHWIKGATEEGDAGLGVHDWALASNSRLEAFRHSATK